MQGASFGLDYAVLGGRYSMLSDETDTIYESEYPFRLGVVLAGAQRTYDVSSLVSGERVSFEKQTPLKGEMAGIQAGLSLEIPLRTSLVAVARIDYFLPSFYAEAQQSGSVVGYGIGVAYGM